MGSGIAELSAREIDDPKRRGHQLRGEPNRGGGGLVADRGGADRGGGGGATGSGTERSSAHPLVRSEP